MPIYEYRCGACGESHEAIQKISDAPLVRCPHCDQDALSKQISAAGFRLAGGGWYETDFKTGSKKNLAGDNGSSSSAVTSKDSSTGSTQGSNAAS
ncbi:FmdB family zinc ribbon protein [Aestuariirhabdus litorea]|uniref:Zinc ribbon domain-containing protein n=1 Tax=Aestuariirhabdus litorea TaxID=2528527 RepID=A0A3P3VRM4_9GAMM|nr:zinc ribbon domain-containing protein [Aestuariirhabdus litorea]RRJ84169.1 zinc ribbon domain-containing protein [Aestuariirhabdus litorea]RWW97389.1 zinc ribbon domain-containing protein [Endozoicomonadaceae bacterium GTF-13]